MQPKINALGGFVLLIILTTLACTIPGRGSSGPAATPTPMGDTLIFKIPVYTYNLEPGGIVPGTRLEYVGRDEGIYNVKIDGLPASKRTGDSFIWNGIMAPGVHGSYNLRITTAILGGLPVGGPVDLTILNPNPIERTALPLNEEIFLAYNNILVNYIIPQGRQIPGSTLIFEGIVTQGEGEQATQLAQLSGLTGYPYLAIGDSLVWMGNLRDNVVVRYNLRALAINDNGLRLDGTAELWILNQ
ncbi:MAG: hypothetical protein H6658_02685 [Ardenticatenaceae bacterium]|nr:hypothetical protein [Ardenticatenaceae bacterium]